RDGDPGGRRSGRGLACPARSLGPPRGPPAPEGLWRDLQLLRPAPGRGQREGHAVRLQAPPRTGGGGALRRARDRGLRLRRRATPPGPPSRLPHRPVARQRGEPAGREGRGPWRGRGEAGEVRGAPPRDRAREWETAVPSRRSQVIEPFLAVEIFQRAQELEREGKDVIH